MRSPGPRFRTAWSIFVQDIEFVHSVRMKTGPDFSAWAVGNAEMDAVRLLPHDPKGSTDTRR